ncbi:unnamed protein product, partial [Ectocarpus fasciculatus]
AGARTSTRRGPPSVRGGQGRGDGTYGRGPSGARGVAERGDGGGPRAKRGPGGRETSGLLSAGEGVRGDERVHLRAGLARYLLELQGRQPLRGSAGRDRCHRRLRYGRLSRSSGATGERHRQSEAAVGGANNKQQRNHR